MELKLTSREHCEIGNATDVVLCCQTREPFRVDLHHNRTPGKLSGGLSHMRRRHTARSAPGSPEVRQNRNLALANDLVELLFVDFDGFADCRQLRLAGTAFANIGKVPGGNAIGSTARGAISNQRHGPILGHQSGAGSPGRTTDACALRGPLTVRSVNRDLFYVAFLSPIAKGRALTGGRRRDTRSDLISTSNS